MTYKPSVYDITFVEVEAAADAAAGLPGGATSGTVDYGGQLGQANDANHKIRLDALQWAIDQRHPGWSRRQGAHRRRRNSHRLHRSVRRRPVDYALPRGADCSGLVTEAYIARSGTADVLGWKGSPWHGDDHVNSIKRNDCMFVPLSTLDWSKDLLPGDILIRPGSPGTSASS